MEMYLHDSSAMLRFVLRGELARASVRQLECAWETATSTLGLRDVVVDASGLSNADTAGRELLARMTQSGARLIPMLPPETTEQPAGTAVPSGTSIRRLRRATRATHFRSLLRQLAGRPALG